MSRQTSRDATAGNVRVLFKVEGGSRVGMGHVMRSLTLADEFRDLGCHVCGFVCNDDSKSGEIIAGRGYEFLAGADSGGPAGLVARIEATGANLVMLDQPASNRPFTRSIRSARPECVIVALDSFDMQDPDVDAIVNLYNHGAMPAPESKRVAYLEGTEYAILRPEFDPYLGRDRVILERAERVLITFGGADPNRLTLRCLEALSGLPGDFAIQAVAGPGFSAVEEILQAAGRDPRIEILREPPVMSELMFRADLCLIGGGTTMLEVAGLGTPALVLAQSAAEETFAASFHARGAVVLLGLGAAIPPDRIREAVRELAADRSLRARMSAAARRLVDGRGRHRIVEVAMQIFGKAHHAV